MNEQDSNAQAQTPPVPAATGPNVDDLQARLDEALKAREGLIRDVQQERAKRQELEARISSPASPAVNPGVTDEVGNLVNPYIAPVARQVAEVNAELENLRIEKTQNYLVSKTGKTWDQIEADKGFQDELGAVIRKYGIGGNVYDRTVRAYELSQLEKLKVKEEERKRAANAAATASLPSGTGHVSTSSTKKYSADEFKRMDDREFGTLESKGTFRKLPDGTFEYTPR